MFRWISIFSSVKRSKKDIQLIRFIIKTFGYRPRELSYFYEALTHKSISNKSNTLKSNERLEFLGDAIFDAVIANYLYSKFPEEDEGYLTKLKSKIVSRKSLSSIAEKIELRKHIVYQKGRSIKISTLEGNAFEALMGAIYLDGGYQAVHNTINHNIFRKYVDITSLLEEEIDFKSKLFIWTQKNKLVLDFKVLTEENTGDKWLYKVEVSINGQTYGLGSGTTKKVAEQAAAKETLVLMGEL